MQEIKRGRAVLGSRGRAASYLARINLELIKAAGERRQARQGRAAGARSPAGLAAAPVVCAELTRPTPSGKGERVTPLGYKTAVRRLPPILARLGDADPRRRAAAMLLDTVERVGSVAGANLEGTASKGHVSDGGATSRTALALRLTLMEALANGWPIERGGKVKRSAPRPILAVQRQNGNRQSIMAWTGLVAICVEGQTTSDLLRAHGWCDTSRTRQAAGAAVLAALDDLADGLGYGRGGVASGVDA